MNELTQNKIALIASSTMLFLQWTAMIFVYYRVQEFNKNLFFIPLITSILLYFLIYYLIEIFIVRNIKMLYKTVSSIGKVSYQDSLRDPELFEKVRDQVEHFSKQKAIEIEHLKENENIRREFLGNVSHELKTPLFNIQGYSDILLDGGLKDKSINKKYLKKISKNTNRLIEIVEDLTLISQAENKQIRLKKTNFHPYELAQEVIESLEEMANEKNITVEIVNNPHIYSTVTADRKRISQVFYNLIENGIFYSPENSHIKIQFHALPDEVLVEVIDNGNGIEAEHLPRLFERFYRIDDNRSRQKGGSGLGLSIVKHILEAHNQSILVESKVGEGTTFKFTLPK